MVASPWSFWMSLANTGCMPSREKRSPGETSIRRNNLGSNAICKGEAETTSAPASRTSAAVNMAFAEVSNRAGSKWAVALTGGVVASGAAPGGIAGIVPGIGRINCCNGNGRPGGGAWRRRERDRRLRRGSGRRRDRGRSGNLSRGGRQHGGSLQNGLAGWRGRLFVRFRSVAQVDGVQSAHVDGAQVLGGEHRPPDDVRHQRDHQLAALTRDALAGEQAPQKRDAGKPGNARRGFRVLHIDETAQQVHLALAQANIVEDLRSEEHTS